MEDIGYILVCLALFLVYIYSFYAQIQVNRTFKKYSRKMIQSGLSGAQVAERMLRSNGIYDVAVEMVSGHLSDHYDPRHKVLRLSEGVYHGRNAAALGVAAHEAGHAIQYAAGYVPVRFRMVILPAVRFGSYGMYLFLLLGVLFSFFPLIGLGIACFALITFFQFVTLPVEFNASRRALASLNSSGYLSSEECADAAKVLRAAAMTYVAAFAASLLQLIRLLLIFRRRD